MANFRMKKESEMGVFRNQSGLTPENILDTASSIGRGVITLLLIGTVVYLGTQFTTK